MAWCLVKHRDNFTFTITCTATYYTELTIVWWIQVSPLSQFKTSFLTKLCPLHNSLCALAVVQNEVQKNLTAYTAQLLL